MALWTLRVSHITRSSILTAFAKVSTLRGCSHRRSRGWFVPQNYKYAYKGDLTVQPRTYSGIQPAHQPESKYSQLRTFLITSKDILNHFSVFFFFMTSLVQFLSCAYGGLLYFCPSICFGGLGGGKGFRRRACFDLGKKK